MMTANAPHILIAEDNIAMADVVRFNLQHAGFRVTVCRNGQEAFDILSAEPFDVVITDYQMPGLNGEELCRKMRGDERLSGMPVIMVSAKGLELDVDALQDELQLQSILYKPFSPRELTRLVQASLEPVEQRP